MNPQNAMLRCFQDCDVETAKSLILSEPRLFDHDGYSAHPLLRAFVESNDGHCYQRKHLLIADLLIPASVKEFRNAVVRDKFKLVKSLLHADPELVHAEFTAGRGIAQAIHHWVSPNVGELLLDAGADIDALNTVHSGETPLTLQVRRGDLDAIRLLLQRGADPNLRPKMHIPNPSMQDTIKLLLDFDWDIQRGHQLLHDAKHGHGRRIAIWLAHEVDPNDHDEAGNTALHIIATSGVGTSAIHALVEAGGDINRKNANGATPLDLALSAEKQSAADALRLIGANTS